MTKSVRVENADNSNHRVKVIVQDKDESGQWVDKEVLALDFPTALATQTIHSSRRLIVEEAS